LSLRKIKFRSHHRAETPHVTKGNENGEAKGLASPRIELEPIASALDAYLPPPNEWT
jgi:hypothetical protein